MRFGILQRYVMGEVLRSFFMALLTITIVFVLFMVMTEATRNGLRPREILELVPFVIPGSLPYTVPVSMLFAVTVVYGRLAGDNEITAVKTAGLSAWTMLWPAISLGLLVSGLLLVASGTAIPASNEQMKKVIFKSVEDLFYKYLKRDREMNKAQWDFSIKVRDVDVDSRILIGATFKHRNPNAKPDPNRVPKPGDDDDPAFFDLIIKADRARITFDIPNEKAHVYLDGSDIQQKGGGHEFVINDSEMEMPLPDDFKKPVDKKLQEKTDRELVADMKEARDIVAFERKREAYAAALWLASGRPTRVNWPGLGLALNNVGWYQQKYNEYATERQMRTAMACGTLFFVLLGGPVGIRFARRDFLSAFITCFVPIILIYYPLMLGGTNVGKEGIADPMVALWAGNLVLALLAAAVLRPVLKH